MKKPHGGINPITGLTDDLVLVHHTVEAFEQSIIDLVGEFEEEDLQVDNPQELIDKGYSINKVCGLATLMTVHIMHNAIHDFMGADGQAQVSDIEDSEMRKTVKDHVPRVVEADDLPQEFKDATNKIVGRL